nr:MAG TPA: hypothetical protein [Caudoviricetes sp.]
MRTLGACYFYLPVHVHLKVFKNGHDFCLGDVWRVSIYLLLVFCLFFVLLIAIDGAEGKPGIACVNSATQRK